MQFQLLNELVEGRDQPLQGTFHQGFAARTQIFRFSIAKSKIPSSPLSLPSFKVNFKIQIKNHRLWTN